MYFEQNSFQIVCLESSDFFLGGGGSLLWFGASISCPFNSNNKSWFVRKSGVQWKAINLAVDKWRVEVVGVISSPYHCLISHYDQLVDLDRAQRAGLGASIN